MSWILFSILAALIWAIVNMIDKYVIDKVVRKPIVPIMILGVVGIISGLLVFLIRGFTLLSNFNIGLAFIAGTFYILSIVLYFRAVKLEEISRIIPLWYLTPLFVLLLATIFLGETFTAVKYLGISLLIMGIILISFKKQIKIGFGTAFVIMLFACFLLSINYVLTKYLLNFADFWTIFAYTKIGMIFPLIPITYYNFKHLVHTAKEKGKKAIALMTFAETLNMVGVISITIAISLGFVSLVNTLSSIAPFFVLFFAIILSKFYPEILKEKISKSAVLLKSIAIVLIFIGVILIT